MNLNTPLIGDTTQRVKIYEASRILKRCNSLDYFVDENEDNAIITISNENGILCIVSLHDDMDDFYVSFNMRLEPLSIIDLTQLLIAIANHIDNIVCKESFTTITTDNKFEILFAPDACEDLGYTPIFWDTENCLGMLQSEPLLNEIEKLNKIKEATTILDRCKNLDYDIDERDDYVSICITTAEDYVVCFITVYPENLNDFYVSFNLRLDPISVVDLAILMHKISSYITMGFIVEKAFVSGVEDKGKLLFFDDAYLDLDYTPLVWNAEDCLNKVS